MIVVGLDATMWTCALARVKKALAVKRWIFLHDLWTLAQLIWGDSRSKIISNIRNFSLLCVMEACIIRWCFLCIMPPFLVLVGSVPWLFVYLRWTQ